MTPVEHSHVQHFAEDRQKLRAAVALSAIQRKQKKMNSIETTATAAAAATASAAGAKASLAARSVVIPRGNAGKVYRKLIKFHMFPLQSRGGRTLQNIRTLPCESITALCSSLRSMFERKSCSLHTAIFSINLKFLSTKSADCSRTLATSMFLKFPALVHTEVALTRDAGFIKLASVTVELTPTDIARLTGGTLDVCTVMQFVILELHVPIRVGPFAGFHVAADTILDSTI
uniref:Uncharacterized protein n=1 Tax=Glossina austeni TaxID=7395 RepID=A0A1A9UMU2_GLOAU